MAVCTYDNPETYQRECWQDGRLLCAYSYLVLPGIAMKPIPGRLFFFGANIGPWEPGQIIGDPAALLGSHPNPAKTQAKPLQSG